MGPSRLSLLKRWLMGYWHTISGHNVAKARRNFSDALRFNVGAGVARGASPLPNVNSAVATALGYTGGPGPDLNKAREGLRDAVGNMYAARIGTGLGLGAGGWALSKRDKV